MKRQIIALTVCLLMTALSTCSLAQYCPICGTNPCREVARRKGIAVVEPPSPRLSPQDTINAASLANRMLNAAANGIKDVKNEAYWRLFNARPTALLNTIDQLSQNHEELKNPTTVEGWAKAVQADCVFGIVKEVYFGALGTAANAGAKIVSQAYSYSSPVVQGGAPGKSRVEQYFGILDGITRQATGTPSKPDCSDNGAPAFADLDHWLCISSLNTVVEDPPVDAEANSIRAKLLHAMMTGYNDAGLFYQAIELKQLAEQRWGAPSDAQYREKIAAEYQRSLAATSAEKIPVLAVQYKHTGDEDEALDIETTHRMLPLDAGQSGVVNFKVTPDPRYAGAVASFFVKCALQSVKSLPDVATTPANNLTIEIKDLKDDFISVTVNNIEIPVAVANNRGGFNAIKFRFEEIPPRANRNAGYLDTLVISVNGQQVATHVLSVSTSSRIQAGPSAGKMARQYRLIPFVYNAGPKDVYQYSVQ